MANIEELSLNSNAFNSLKLDFKRVLNAGLDTMFEKNVDEGEISIKLAISLEDGPAPDTEITAYEASKNVTHPIFKHKIGFSMKVKCEDVTGKVGGADYYLSQKQNGTYSLVPCGNAQESLFDDDDEVVIDEDEEATEEDLNTGDSK